MPSLLLLLLGMGNLEYMQAYRAAKGAEKLAEAAKGQPSVQSVFKNQKQVGEPETVCLGMT